MLIQYYSWSLNVLVFDSPKPDVLFSTRSDFQVVKWWEFQSQNVEVRNLFGYYDWSSTLLNCWDIPNYNQLSVRIILSGCCKIIAIRWKSQTLERRDINCKHDQALSWVIIPYSNHWIWPFLAWCNHRSILAEREAHNWFWMAKEKSLLVSRDVHGHKGSSSSKQNASFLRVFRPLKILASLSIVSNNMV